MTPTDPFLRLPLTGVHLIEASAGTGKTFTLATLVTRLVVERRLRIGQILAVTFTEAATQELRKRIRERLTLAASLVPETPDAAATSTTAGTAVADGLAATRTEVGADASAMGPSGDAVHSEDSVDAAGPHRRQAPGERPSPLTARGQAARLPDASHPGHDAPDVALSRAIIAAHLQSGAETPAQLRQRLQQAADEIDLAAIFTIHGFCARVLREHALESGQAFAPPELLANDRDLRQELAADLWRSTAADAQLAPLLVSLWPRGPEALARDLGELIRQPELLPPLPTEADSTDRIEAELHRAAQALADGFAVHGDSFRAALLEAVEHKRLNGQSYKAEWIQDLRRDLAQWCAARDWSAPAHARLPMLLTGTLEAKTNKGKATPTSPLSALISSYLAALDDLAQAQARARVRLLHRIRDQARLRLAQRKQQLRVQTYDDLIDGVADALRGPHAPALVQRLRAQYAVALVDEFQDTDTRQWDIFRTVFGQAEETCSADVDALAAADSPLGFENARATGSQARFLALIGDPKQAIYGFRGGDVDTYLSAKNAAERAPALKQNFRSRPSVLTAITALYEHAQKNYDAGEVKEPPFVDRRIEFQVISPGGVRVDADYQRAGVDAPALTLWQAPEPPADQAGKRKPWSASRSRELATQACVAAIHDVLSQAREGAALIRGKPVQPGDIAVLVRKHAEATRIQRALAEVGIAAVAAGQQSLFATAEARELLTLLLALLHTADDGRLRAALATVLLGVDAAGIAALETDGAGHAQWQGRALAWRERWQRGGPLALVSDLCADNAERLLGLLDGERRLTNYLQLGELLQEADARALGLQGLVDWLGQRIAQADAQDEAQLLRLESDARRVQIVTLHKSKGLEYPLVFLPFVGIGGSARRPERSCVVADEDGRRWLHWNLQPETSGWKTACERKLLADRAEDARLLYVGLTRAEHALWIATGDFYNARQTALWPMLDALPQTAGIARDAALPAALPWLPPLGEGDAPKARRVQRRIAPDWWVYSFTQLANADSGNVDLSTRATVAPAGGHDEPEGQVSETATLSTETFDPRFAGNRFGVVLHQALEDGDFAAWRHWHPGDAAPDGERTTIEAALKGGGYAAEDLDAGVQVLTALIGQTLTVVLPEGVRLCQVPPEARRAEIEFQFALRPTGIDALLALLHAHGVVRERGGFGLRRTLEGLMTGLIDLTYTHEGRWYVLDYKSNRLPAYDAATLQQAMAHSEYDLQALIYTLALHRWLRFRLGDGYDYARDFGGIRYLFCRGLDADRADSPGVHAQRFAPALIHALDALFAGAPVGDAA